MLRRRDENVVISTYAEDVDIAELNSFMYRTCGIEPRDPEKWRVALEHSSAIVVAFSVPLMKPTPSRLGMESPPSPSSSSTPSPLESIKATAQQILKNSTSGGSGNGRGGTDHTTDAHVAASRNTRRLVGFARAYSDGAFSAMISDVAVDEKYKNGDVGKKILTVLIEKLKTVGIGSFAAMVPGYSHGFFHDSGFRETYLRALRFQCDNEDGHLTPLVIDETGAEAECAPMVLAAAEAVSSS